MRRRVSTASDAGKVGELHRSMKLEHTLHTDKLDWLQDLHSRHKAVKPSDINCSNVFLDQPPKAKEVKVKITMGPNQTDKILHSKGIHEKVKKTAHRMGENIHK